MTTENWNLERMRAWVMFAMARKAQPPSAAREADELIEEWEKRFPKPQEADSSFVLGELTKFFEESSAMINKARQETREKYPDMFPKPQDKSE